MIISTSRFATPGVDEFQKPEISILELLSSYVNELKANTRVFVAIWRKHSKAYPFGMFTEMITVTPVEGFALALPRN